MVLLLSAATGELSGWSVAQVGVRGMVSVGFLVLGGTVLGFGAYTWLLQATSTAAAGTYAFVNPIVALALAWLVGDEPFALRTVFAGIVVVAGVLLISRSPQPRVTCVKQRIIPSAVESRLFAEFSGHWR